MISLNCFNTISNSILTKRELCTRKGSQQALLSADLVTFNQFNIVEISIKFQRSKVPISMANMKGGVFEMQALKFLPCEMTSQTSTTDYIILYLSHMDNKINGNTIWIIPSPLPP